MWFVVQNRSRKSGVGQKWIIRFGGKHLDLRWAWGLAWAKYRPCFGLRGKRTQDGWQCYIDVRPLHAKAAWHNRTH